jgi:cellulose biosynthesis protein BcsQ
MANAYVLAVASHKGGTGRTTTALALAWHWGQTGRRVTLVDADPGRTAGLVALNTDGVCIWPNVQYRAALPAPGDSAFDADLVVVDCPSLLGGDARSVLWVADGALLTCVADPLSLRTVPAAVGVLVAARTANPRLELLGLAITVYNSWDSIQPPMLARLRQMHSDVLVEPPVPFDAGLRDWSLEPGAGLPPGSAADAYAALATALEAVVPAGRLAAHPPDGAGTVA